MANIGDEAQAAGMDLVPATSPEPGGPGKVQQGNVQMNKTRDYIAQFFQAAKAYVDSALSTVSVPWSRVTGRPTITTAATANTVVQRDGSGGIVGRTFWSETQGTGAGHLTRKDYVDSVAGGVKPGQDVTFGQVYLPSSYAASSGYTVAYINADGRIARGASSERYKKHISAVDPDDLGDIWPVFHRFQMRADGNVPDDHTWRYGYIAEQLAEHPDQAAFAVVIDGQVESIDFIGLLLSQVAQLHKRVADLEGGQA
ncbi:hypothetical protein E4V99_14020 [Microbacterium sp. dk485]|uniref:tail fiber domain-containing protein n=1 Tax=Microbacterium sp. dk485 TaxID=2560021 RepID=UPI0010742FE8|nr:tail fiber domain-containing protein [Microbacterium sp. dk485]TFV82046.1 hypothetical protein E4V99_14020 [Microbacterium sp. dk485]